MANNDTTNKKVDLKFSILEPREIQIPTPVENVNRNGLVQFGEDNLFPYHLFDYYLNCSILQSIINGMLDYIAGEGFAPETNLKSINRKGDNLYSLLRKITLDYLIFGAFSVQILRDKYGKISELYWVDTRKVRLDENEEKIYYCNWDKGRKQKPVEYKRWFKGSREKNVIYYYKNPIARDVYGTPIWGAALKDVTTFIEIGEFHLNNILNNFSVSAVLSFNNGIPSEEEQHQIEKKVLDKFAGAKKAGKTLVSFSDSAENAPTLSRLGEDNFDQKYNALYETTKNNIFTAFRCQPQLFGCDPQRTGFNSVEYIQSFKLYKTTIIRPIQSEIETFFKDVLGISETLREYNIVFDENGTTTEGE